MSLDCPLLIAPSVFSNIYLQNLLATSVVLDVRPEILETYHVHFTRYSYQTLCMFSFEINESSLSDTRCVVQDVVSPQCGDKRMARRCTIRSLPNYFVMTSYHWNAGKHIYVSNVNIATV